MRLGKRIGRSDWARDLLCWTTARYVRFAFATTRWRLQGQELSDSLFHERKPFLSAFWHGRMLLVPFTIPRRLRHRITAKAIVSQHRDGELIARALHLLGVEGIRGSSSHGGMLALRQALRTLQAQIPLGVALDGPRGPRMRVQPGIIALARHTGVPIIPVTWAVSRRKVIHSWDRFVVPLPFGRGVFLWGEPIYVPRDADEAGQEAARLTLETALIGLTAEADRLVGVEPIAPDPDTARHPSGTEAPALARASAP